MVRKNAVNSMGEREVKSMRIKTGEVVAETRSVALANKETKAKLLKARDYFELEGTEPIATDMARGEKKTGVENRFITGTHLFSGNLARGRDPIRQLSKMKKMKLKR